MANIPNRKRPTIKANVVLACYVNPKDIKPRFFIPKTELSEYKITCFQKAMEAGKCPMISFDMKTRLFFCHNVETKPDDPITHDNCMSLILHFQLSPVYYNGLYWYKPPQIYEVLQRFDFKMKVCPDEIYTVHQKQRDQKIITGNSRHKHKKLK